MTLTLKQDERLMRKKLCSYSVVKWHEVTNTFAMDVYVREIAAKKSCKYGEHGSFVILLFMYSVSQTLGCYGNSSWFVFLVD